MSTKAKASLKKAPPAKALPKAKPAKTAPVVAAPEITIKVIKKGLCPASTHTLHPKDERGALLGSPRRSMATPFSIRHLGI